MEGPAVASVCVARLDELLTQLLQSRNTARFTDEAVRDDPAWHDIRVEARHTLERLE